MNFDEIRKKDAEYLAKTKLNTKRIIQPQAAVSQPAVIQPRPPRRRTVMPKVSYAPEKAEKTIHLPGSENQKSHLVPILAGILITLIVLISLSALLYITHDDDKKNEEQATPSPAVEATQEPENKNYDKAKETVSNYVSKFEGFRSKLKDMNILGISSYTKYSATEAPSEAPSAEPTKVSEKKEGRGTAQTVSKGIQDVMRDAYSEDVFKEINFEELRYLVIPYWSFDTDNKGNMKKKDGEMVVHKDVAEDVLDIFAELYEEKYPIERMELIERFVEKPVDLLATDRKSMAYNNTYSFCYRNVEGTNDLSLHACGRAIDINPRINPVVKKDGTVQPKNSEKYAKGRNKKTANMAEWNIIEKEAFIGEGTSIYKKFKDKDWKWLGRNGDYHHFEIPKKE